MIYVIDLFCGAGGFSQGAVDAGAVVVLAVDHWKVALDVHALNHSDCEHWCRDLGGSQEEFVSDVNVFLKQKGLMGKHIHVHASPPCQNLSSYTQRFDRKEIGLAMVKWAVEIMDLLRPMTWTLEQVPHLEVISMLRAHGNVAVIDCSEFGISQTRRRVIAGTFNQTVLTAHKESPVTMRDVFASVRYTPPRKGMGMTTVTRIRDKQGKLTKDRVKSFDAVGYTICAVQPRMFDPVLHTSQMIPREVMAALQTFPPGYKFGVHFRQMIANSVPPKLACKVMRSLSARPSSADDDLHPCDNVLQCSHDGVVG